MDNFVKFGIHIPEILMPKKGTDLKAWSVIACDQYTQDKEYWKAAEQLAFDKPSTLNLILPEVYLNDSDKNQRIDNIRKCMQSYITSGVFDKPENQMVYVERQTAYGRTRKGLVTAIDLETYEWKPFSKALIRSTEATIVERIPPRMEIRRNAPLESPHIMLLVNDPNSLIEKCCDKAKQKIEQPLYDTDLMQNSGHITGWSINNSEIFAEITKSLDILYKQNTLSDNSVFMFAVGDGNHSLATAKAVWDEFKLQNGGIKKDDGSISIPKSIENHNARFALIEIVNLFNEGLTFEPIHRVLFNVDNNNLVNFCAKNLDGIVSNCLSETELQEKVASSKAFFGFIWEENGIKKYKCLETIITDLAVSKLQPVLDTFLQLPENKDKAQIDYIHGTDEVFRLGEKPNTVSILLPPIAKNSFFKTIATNGPLPRKSFSMGEASEKRFYMECRKLFN